MTLLPPSEQREAAGINTVRRGIVYALHLLKTVNGLNVDLARTVSVNNEGVNARLLARITLNYDENIYLLYGSNPLKGVVPFASGAVNHSYGNLAGGTGYTIPDLPPEINSLELYLLWLTQRLAAVEAAQNPPKIDAVKVSQGKNSDGFYFKWEYNFSFDYLIYNQTGNMIAAIDNGDAPEPVFALFDNNSVINNSFVVGN